ncbi:helix-turn-helix domain-containing protein [Cloacibacterium normanense]|uniref:AAA domain protein n=1 Tax=Cloacibacterium normanense TaxID=237258 RepID=A0A1E5UCK9_9FLAO|nr:helix-turn-helix domain-containing protein [Cloacibacterium normanense]AZI68573.1 AAA family ATPase [Cloacibacterium normanense]OEL10663.1 AAA domain protein [Cloacibacterium normanense]SDO62365.1 Helix-turn-helix domain-containing protein [Cloacibacterium normanense]
MNNQLFDLVENTSRNIFLTGKAGTGKTTFLNNFVKKTRKKHIVVAPTGIAAINAGGVTIHSMFGFPLRTFIPTLERINENLAMNIPDLMQHFKYRKDKLKLLREVEVIIVDEVSMLRADVLDMMDFSLRHIRRNQEKFGGVQMLFIGDLYQLPPVVRDENEYIMKQFYASPFFFDAFVLKNTNLLTVELTEVFRQKDEDFLEILNEIRDGNLSREHYEKLHERYIPEFEPKEEAYVYLTSHNRIADDINTKKLNELGGKTYQFKAKIVGDFKESQFPNEEVLELKVGAQVMFIRNDATQEKKYFNGKLAEVVDLSADEIWVRIDGDDEDYKLKKENWEQKKYSLDAEKNIEEEVLGSFEQYPIRLAWAVTIHKSQGLTFDRLIVDAGKSFASGQVYVALSRCRTLEGIVLKSKISSDVIFSDRRVAEFQDATHANDRLEEILHAEKYDYSIRKVLRYLDISWTKESLETWNKASKESKFVDKEKTQNLYYLIKKSVENLTDIYLKFEKIIWQKTKKFIQNQENWQEIESKAEGAVNFFFGKVKEEVFKPFKDFYAETKGVKGMKQYNDDTRTFLDDLEEYLNDLKNVHLLEKPLFDQKNDEKISVKVVKIPTQNITFQLFEEGKSIGEIAKERGILVQTVFGHLGKFVENGQLEIERIIAKEYIQDFEIFYKTKFIENPEQYESLNELKRELPHMEFHELRVLRDYFKNNS